MYPMTPSVRRLIAVAAIALQVAACGNTGPTPSATLAAAVATATPTASASASPLATDSPTPSDSPSPSPTDSPSPSPTAAAKDLTKTPFTVLVLGGDDGFRTDAVIIAGIDPVARKVTYMSIPRDTIDVPLPGGGVFRGQKINAFYNYAAANPSTYPQGPGRATADMIQQLLHIRIDFYAATTFGGFVNLVNAMGGVRVNVPKAVVDPYYQVTTTQVGISFSAGPQVMNGSRGLIYSRTRQGDNDFERSRRQQVFLTGAGMQLLAHPEQLPALIAALSNLRTDFPITQVAGLLSTIRSIPAASISTGTVLGPSTYSYTTPCACGYALEPKLAAMRSTAAKLIPWAVLH